MATAQSYSTIGIPVSASSSTWGRSRRFNITVPFLTQRSTRPAVHRVQISRSTEVRCRTLVHESTSFFVKHKKIGSLTSARNSSSVYAGARAYCQGSCKLVV